MFPRFNTKVNVLQVTETDDDAGTTTKQESMRHFELPAYMFVETRQHNDEETVHKKITSISDRIMYTRQVVMENTDIVIHDNVRYEIVYSYPEKKVFQVTLLRKLE